MIALEKNLVWRPFVGGKLLGVFDGDPKPADNHFPERWICSTTSSSDGEGLSKTSDGKTLKSLICKKLDILVKIIDSYTRLMIQVHPNDAQAQAYFHYPYGKCEAWYILDVRTIDGVEPYIYLGFKEGISRQAWIDVCKSQDIERMERMLNRIPVKPGQAFMIPAGVPHAMGSGVFFAEVQQPTDITLRTERISPDGREMSDIQMNGGATWEQMFDCFSYEGRSLEETIRTFDVRPKGSTILKAPLFSIEDGIFPNVSVSQGKYAIILMMDGPEKGNEYYVDDSFKPAHTVRMLVFRGK